jgi:hypothetical protein
MWRPHFGRGFGFVVRQTTKLMNEFVRKESELLHIARLNLDLISMGLIYTKNSIQIIKIFPGS